MPYTRILSIFLLLITTCFHGLGQYNTLQNKLWVFGRNAGLNFHSGSPVRIATGVGSDLVGGAAMACGSIGELLFYTNGKTVWNRGYDTMSGGASIVPFNTCLFLGQPSVIAPVLSRADQYYIFSLESVSDPSVLPSSRLAYSIVDMSLNGGLGGVTATRGVIIDSLLSQRMVVVPGNNCDFWLIVYKRYTSVFLSYHITSAGIDLSPVVSPGIGVEDGLGVIKMSHDRRSLVKVSYSNSGSNTALCDWNADAGNVSGCRLIGNNGYAYTAEFSPDNSKLYVVDSTLWQYDVSLTTTAAIIASRYNVGGFAADLKLAPDGQIYATEKAASPDRYLDCITYPNLGGAACSYVLRRVDISPGVASYGLPATYWSPIAGVTPGPVIGDSMVCTGATMLLSNAVAGGSWSSSNSAVATVSAGGLVSGVSAGIVTISYSNNCGVSSTTITVNSTPILSPAAATICLGQSLTLSFGPTGGTWSQSVTGVATIDNSGTVHAQSVGATIITYILPGNCFSITSIAVNEIPVIAPSADTLCANASTQLSFSPAGGYWSSSATSIATVNAVGLLSGISGGSAVVSYSLGGCTATSTVTIKPAPDIVPSLVKLCVGSTFQLSSSVAGGTWGNWIAMPAAFVDPNGVVHAFSEGLSVILYAAIGCMASATIDVRPPPTPITGRSLLCQGYTTQLSNGVSGGTWSTASASIATIDAGSYVVGVGAGSTLISYTTAVGAGCFTTYSITVTPSPGAGIITGPARVCVGDSIALTNAVAGGMWSSDDMGMATVSASGVVSGLAQGNVIITYTIADTCGTATAFKTVTVGTLPDAGVITGDSVVCMGNSIALSHTAAGGSWFSADAALASVSMTGIVTGAGTGTTLIGYHVSNDCGSDTAWYPVRTAPLPSAGAIAGLSRVCIGATFQLSNTIAGGAWGASPPGVIALSSGGDVTAVGQGIRIITYTVGPDGDGCVGTATHSVTVTTAASFSVTATVTQPLCYGDTTGAISLSALGNTPPYKYLWSTLDTVATLSHLADGTYYSSVTETITNCNVPDTFRIASPPQLIIALAATGDQCRTGKGSIAASVTGGSSPYTYAWSTGAFTSDITALHAGIYSLSVTDANGCARLAEATLTDTCSTLVIHDAITPNGDGINDVWVIEGINLYPANTVQVFDKWGDLIYEQTNYQNNWAATGKRGPAPDGTYYYLIRLNAPDINGEQNTFTGSIFVKR